MDHRSLHPSVTQIVEFAPTVRIWTARIVMNVVQNAGITAPTKSNWLHRAGLQSKTDDNWLLDLCLMIEHINLTVNRVVPCLDADRLRRFVQLPALVRFGAPGETPLLVAEPDIGHERTYPVSTKLWHSLRN